MDDYPHYRKNSKISIVQDHVFALQLPVLRRNTKILVSLVFVWSR